MLAYSRLRNRPRLFIYFAFLLPFAFARAGYCRMVPPARAPGLPHRATACVPTLVVILTNINLLIVSPHTRPWTLYFLLA